MSSGARADRLWIAGAVLVAALFAFFALLLPARDVTFYWDDWLILDRFVRLSRPGAWFLPENQQWEPVAFPFLDLERALFGPRHVLYLGVQWALHVVNVTLLALLLRERCGDARAGAVAAATFGVAACWREVLWFWVDTTILLCALATLAGFLAAERARRDPRRRWVVLACAAVAMAPGCWGGGLALGPALALEAWSLAPRGERLRRALPFALTWGAYVAVYLAVSASAPGRGGQGFARTPEQLRGSFLFLVEVVGLGFVQQVPGVQDRVRALLGQGPIAGAVLAFGYAVAVGVVAWTLDARARARLVLAHVYLLLLLGPMALARWYHNDREFPLAMASRYQYLPALAWTTLIAVRLARAPRALLAVAVVVVALLAVRHARTAASDGTMFSPASPRARGPEWLAALERVARSARGPLHDVRAPVWLAPPELPASRLLAIVAPDVAPVWTTARTPETAAPYAREPAFATRDGGR